MLVFLVQDFRAIQFDTFCVRFLSNVIVNIDHQHDVRSVPDVLRHGDSEGEGHYDVKVCLIERFSEE